MFPTPMDFTVCIEWYQKQSIANHVSAVDQVLKLVSNTRQKVSFNMRIIVASADV